MIDIITLKHGTCFAFVKTVKLISFFLSGQPCVQSGRDVDKISVLVSPIVTGGYFMLEILTNGLTNQIINISTIASFKLTRFTFCHNSWHKEILRLVEKYFC